MAEAILFPSGILAKPGQGHLWALMRANWARNLLVRFKPRFEIRRNRNQAPLPGRSLITLRHQFDQLTPSARRELRALCAQVNPGHRHIETWLFRRLILCGEQSLGLRKVRGCQAEALARLSIFGVKIPPSR